MFPAGKACLSRKNPGFASDKRPEGAVCGRQNPVFFRLRQALPAGNIPRIIKSWPPVATKRSLCERTPADQLHIASIKDRNGMMAGEEEIYQSDITKQWLNKIDNRLRDNKENSKDTKQNGIDYHK